MSTTDAKNVTPAVGVVVFGTPFDGTLQSKNMQSLYVKLLSCQIPCHLAKHDADGQQNLQRVSLMKHMLSM